MRIMAKEANNRMSCMKLPDRRYTQSGRKYTAAVMEG
jgi:hypothetical protein